MGNKDIRKINTLEVYGSASHLRYSRPGEAYIQPGLGLTDIVLQSNDMQLELRLGGKVNFLSYEKKGQRLNGGAVQLAIQCRRFLDSEEKKRRLYLAATGSLGPSYMDERGLGAGADFGFGLGEKGEHWFVFASLFGGDFVRAGGASLWKFGLPFEFNVGYAF